MSKRLKLLTLAISTLLVGTLAISNQSFWIDEGAAALKAIQPTVGDWWGALRAEGHSNLQLLPHLFYLWAWEKVFGPSEVALRAANLPLLFLGLAAALWALQHRPKLQLWFCLLALINSFTWYYISEARPYILLFAASCIALGSLIRMMEELDDSSPSQFTFAVFCAGIFLVSATSLIAVPWAIAWVICCVLLVGLPNFLAMVRRNLLTSVCFVAGMIGLAAYYSWTLQLGARASGIGTTSFSNLFVVIYEQLGLIGLGPGRTELRVVGAGGLRPYAFSLSLGLLASLLLPWEAVRSIPRSWWTGRRALVLFIGIVAPLVAVLFAGHVAHVRLLGRHLMPLFPILLFGLALGMRRLQDKKSALSFVALIAIPLIFLASALEVRFARRHSRDDYRGAALLALQTIAQDGTVWWAADESTGRYYRLPLGESGRRPGQGSVTFPTTQEIEGGAEPTLIVISKPDVYDPSGAIATYAEKHGFAVTHVLQSFRILEKPGVKKPLPNS